MDNTCLGESYFFLSLMLVLELLVLGSPTLNGLDRNSSMVGILLFAVFWPRMLPSLQIPFPSYSFCPRIGGGTTGSDGQPPGSTSSSRVVGFFLCRPMANNITSFFRNDEKYLAISEAAGTARPGFIHQHLNRHSYN